VTVIHQAGSVGYIPQGIFNIGWWAVFVFLFAVVFLEAQATYWIGRGVVAGALKTRWRRRFEGPGMNRAHRALERWGPVAVPVSFVTVGLRSGVQAAAGFARMRYATYTLVMLPGCAAWAALYTAIAVAVSAFAQGFVWWATLLLSVALAAGIVVLVIRRRRSGDSSARTPR
jgi:membrane protein DedA with SNARE-associated domain